MLRVNHFYSSNSMVQRMLEMLYCVKSTKTRQETNPLPFLIVLEREIIRKE